MKKVIRHLMYDTDTAKIVCDGITDQESMKYSADTVTSLYITRHNAYFVTINDDIFPIVANMLISETTEVQHVVNWAIQFSVKFATRERLFFGVRLA